MSGISTSLTWSLETVQSDTSTREFAEQNRELLQKYQLESSLTDLKLLEPSCQESKVIRARSASPSELICR